MVLDSVVHLNELGVQSTVPASFVVPKVVLSKPLVWLTMAHTAHCLVIFYEVVKILQKVQLCGLERTVCIHLCEAAPEIRTFPL